MKINQDGYGTYVSDCDDGVSRIETITYKNLCQSPFKKL